jgi:hypothetical protein
MNNFNNQIKFMLLRSYWGSAHAILSPSDELNVVSKKADMQIIYPCQKQYQIYVILEPNVPYFRHFSCAQVPVRQFVGHIFTIAMMSL